MMDYDVACDACGAVFNVEIEPDFDTEYLCQECDGSVTDWDDDSHREVDAYLE